MSDGPPAAAATDPARWMDEHGDYLYRMALARVGRPDVAEDLVQETLLSALGAADRFAGRSSERTWLTSILKNKIIDRLRRKQPVSATDAGAAGPPDGLFDAAGHWRTPPGRWAADPAELLERREFWEAFERCRQELPERLREVLTLRLLDDVPATKVCQALGVSPSNLWTLLYRARVRLWQCLNARGFGRRADGGKP
jgi:RNA polymerase sigma-70 factor (ECF subfamily)